MENRTVSPLTGNSRKVDKLKKEEELTHTLINPANLSTFFFNSRLSACDLLSLAGLALPKDPLKIFPFFVFLSPLPMIELFVVQMS